MLSSMQQERSDFMTEWEISDQDIESTEKLLLPDGAHFSKEARDVIRCWNSTDVVACPGSGKTTILLAKLKLIVDRMPLENGAGICVLSHTNVAVNEIKKRLPDYAGKLLSYPNHIGTIQSFVNKYVTMPYLRNIVGKNVQEVDKFTYAQHMLNRMQGGKYKELNYVTKKIFESDRQITNRVEYLQELKIRDDGSLCVGNRVSPLAGKDTTSTKQYNALIEDLLKEEGIIRYQDAYLYAKDAINTLPKTFTDLFSLRFQYVFIDEYQDCDSIQKQAIDMIFNPTKCTVIKLGDPDQAIYNSLIKQESDWIPKPEFLSISSSCRYSQEIADVIGKLKKGDQNIIASIGKSGMKPVLLIFDPNKIDRVISEFIDILETRGLYKDKGVYKAIGAAKNSSGLKIGSYWPEFDSTVKKQRECNYWTLIDDIVTSLLDGNLYKAERIVRKLLLQIFRYAKIKHPVSGKEYSITSITKELNNEYQEMYSQWIYELSRIQNFERESINHLMLQKINELLKVKKMNAVDIFRRLPEYFFDKSVVISQTSISEKNIFIDQTRGYRIEFDTIHGVKGETHDATLYLETVRNRASDLNRILPYYGVGECGNSRLFDYSRKLAYVGMSRPKKLLCVAMQTQTYEKSNGIFTDDWEIIELRE